MHSGRVGHSVDLHASDDHHNVGRGARQLNALGRLGRVTRAREQEPPLAGSGGAAPDVGEVVRPRVHELQHVVPIGGVGNMQHQRPRTQIERGQHVQGVVVGRHERRLRSE